MPELQAEPPADIMPGAQLGQYRIVERLGVGGMGSVYEAVHTGIDKTFALKVLSRDLAEDPRAQARFMLEAMLASRLDHPHVVKVTDFAAKDGIFYLVMELLRGEDLAEAIHRQARGMPFEEAVDVLLGVASGVYAAHQANVVHRDLKPSNVFLARNRLGDREPKVLDFGISKQDGLTAGTVLTASGALVGTVPYLSPEHVKGATPDARSDQYALGVILYECLTGRKPHEGHTPYAVMQNIAEGRFFPPSALNDAIPAALERHILRAMSTEPAARFSSVHAFGRALLPFASERQKVRWSEYFGPVAEDGGAATAEVPAPLAPAISTRTTLLPEIPAGALTAALPPQPPLRRSAPRRPPEPRAEPRTRQPETPRRPSQPELETRSGPQSVSRGRPAPDETIVVAPSRRGWGVGSVLLGAALAVAIVWAGPRVVREGATLIGHRWPATTLATSPAAGVSAERVGPATATEARPAIAAAPNPPAQPATPARAPTGAVAPTPERAPTPEPVPTPETATHEPPVPDSPPQAPDSTPPPPAPAITLTFVTQPSGAQVWLDGERRARGVTPLALRLPASSSPRRVSMRLRGYRAAVIDVVPNQVDEASRVELALEPLAAAPVASKSVRKPRGARRTAPPADDVVETEPRPTPDPQDPQELESRYEKILE
jgi:serine/threonine-protein kinase